MARAREAECDVALLPECLDFGWTYPGAKGEAEPVPGPTADRISDRIPGLDERRRYEIPEAWYPELNAAARHAGVEFFSE